MNARDPNACREGGQKCILDPPALDDWLFSGRVILDMVGSLSGSEVSQVTDLTTLDLSALESLNVTARGAYALRMFMEINATVTAGAINYRASNGEHCAFGHTDVAHALLSEVDTCRPLTEGDTCSPIPIPFVCACVSQDVAFAAKDTLGDPTRFNFVMLGLVCCVVAFVYLALIGLSYIRRCLHRHRDFKRGMRVMQQLMQQPRDVDDTPTRIWTEDDEEMRELWRCAALVTFLVTVIGGPGLLLISHRWPLGYWAGCGFQIRDVPDVVARPEFGANRAAG